MDLGTAIKNQRKNRGLTQHEFAANCAITQTYLSQIENNQKEPNLSTLKVISENLDLPLPFLFFLSLSEDDVKSEKRDAFKVISPSINAFVNEFFNVPKK